MRNLLNHDIELINDYLNHGGEIDFQDVICSNYTVLDLAKEEKENNPDCWFDDDDNPLSIEEIAEAIQKDDQWYFKSEYGIIQFVL